MNKTTFLDIRDYWKEEYRNHSLIETNTWKKLFFYKWVDELAEWDLWEYDWKDKESDSRDMFITIFIGIDWFK